jgi:hypothetical protein
MPMVSSSFVTASQRRLERPRVHPRCPGPEADHTVDDGKFVGIVSRFELSDLEPDRPVEKTGRRRTAFGIWMRRRSAPIFG